MNGNELTAVPFLGEVTELQTVNLNEDPLPFTYQHLRAALGLNSNTILNFKSQERSQEEHELFGAIMAGDVEGVHQLLHGIRIKYIYKEKPIDIAKIRDPYGNNLLHAAIQRMGEHLKQITKQMNALVQNKTISKELQKSRLQALETQKNGINDRYMKIFSILLNCGEKCADDMLHTANAEGQPVIMAMLAKLGPDNPLFLTIEKVLLEEEEEFNQEKKIKALQAHEEIEKERIFEDEKKIKAIQAEEAHRKEQKQQTAQLAIKERKKQTEKEEKASRETVAQLMEQETAPHKKQLIDQLTELREVADKNKMPQVSKQVQQALNLIDEQPYTADVLSLAVGMLKQVNRPTNIKHRKGPKKLSDLLEPIISSMDRDIKALNK